MKAASQLLIGILFNAKQSYGFAYILKSIRRNTMKYPKWNKDRVVYEFKVDILRVGSDDDDVYDIKGNVKVWKDIIDQFTGKNSIEDIQNYVYYKYKVDREKTINFIETFEKNHFLEVLDKPYNEADSFYSYFESATTYYSSVGLGGLSLLNRLQKLKITVLGCGAGGSHIAYYLSQCGIGNLHLVDPDKVDKTNVNRQELFKMDDIGLYKVDTLKKSIEEKNPYINISVSYNKQFTVADVEKEIIGSNFVVCCMDEPPYIAQRITNRACFNFGIDSAYCFSQKSAGKMFFVSPQKSACSDCLLLKHDSEDFQYLVSKFLNLSSDLVTANIKPNIALLCSWASKKIFDYISDLGTVKCNVLYRFDFNKFEEVEFDVFEKNASCPTCGKYKDNSYTKLWEIIELN